MRALRACIVCLKYIDRCVRLKFTSPLGFTFLKMFIAAGWITGDYNAREQGHLKYSQPMELQASLCEVLD